MLPLLCDAPLLCRCDFARIGQVKASSVKLARLVSYASNSTGEEVPADEDINDAGDDVCAAMMAESESESGSGSGGSESTQRRRRMLLLTETSETMSLAHTSSNNGDGDASGRALQSTGSTVTSVRPLFSTLFQLMVTSDAPIVAATARGQNAVEAVAAAVAKAMASSQTSTAAGASPFSLAASTWTRVSNLTSAAAWSSLSFFTVDSVQQYNSVPGAAVAPSNISKWWPAAVGGSVSALLLGAVFAFLLTRRRYTFPAEALAACEAAAADSAATNGAGAAADAGTAAAGEAAFTSPSGVDVKLAPEAAAASAAAAQTTSTAALYRESEAAEDANTKRHFQPVALLASPAEPGQPQPSTSAAQRERIGARGVHMPDVQLATAAAAPRATSLHTATTAASVASGTVAAKVSGSTSGGDSECDLDDPVPSTARSLMAAADQE